MNVRKNSKLIRSGYYVFSGRGEFLNCLHCSALALLLHSAIKWPIQYPRTEKGLCGISKSEMLASECDPEGKKGESGGGRLSVWHPPWKRQRLASGLGEPPGAPSALQ